MSFCLCAAGVCPLLGLSITTADEPCCPARDRPIHADFQHDIRAQCGHLCPGARPINFVPGGEATRERTHILILAGAIILGFATCVHGNSITSEKKDDDESDSSRKALLRKRHLPSKAMASKN